MADANVINISTNTASPLVSICVVAHNEQHCVARCLKSLVSPIAPANRYEICVFDNASTDNTLLEVEKFALAHPEVTLRWWKMEHNHLGRARASAIFHSRAEYVAFIDADCVAPPGWCDGLVAAFLRTQSHCPEVAGVGGGNAPPSIGDFLPTLSLMCSSYLGSFGSIQGRAPLSAKRVPHLSTCNAIFRRKDILKIGNFSPHFARVGEDLELSLRLRKNNFALFSVAGWDVVHWHSPHWGAWIHKMFRYGRAQILVGRIHPLHLLSRKVMPLLAALAWLVLLAHSPRSAIIVMSIYFLFILIFSLWLCRQKQEFRGNPLRLVGLFVATHWAYALGEVSALSQIPWQSGRLSSPPAPIANGTTETEDCVAP